MVISAQASILSLPRVNPGVTTVLEYLIIKFPHIAAPLWHQRIADGKVHWHDGSLITAESLFKSQQRVCYYREVESEPCIPFEESILFQDSHILVAYKPHFLPVTPGGLFVNECLQNRLRQRTGHSHLQALHRLDRVTAGLVLFSINPDTRHLYHHLFETRQIHKTYQAIASINHLKVTQAAQTKNDKIEGKEWRVKNRIVPSDPRFCMQVVKGEANSHSVIRCLQQQKQQALFELHPVTGKTHQLRLHMQTIGWPILNDKYYPTLQALSPDNYAKPLQLLAKKIEFTDPITHVKRSYTYSGNLIF